MKCSLCKSSKILTSEDSERICNVEFPVAPKIFYNAYAGGHYIAFPKCFCLNCGNIFLDSTSGKEVSWNKKEHCWESIGITKKEAINLAEGRDIVNIKCECCKGTGSREVKKK